MHIGIHAYMHTCIQPCIHAYMQYMQYIQYIATQHKYNTIHTYKSFKGQS